MKTKEQKTIWWLNKQAKIKKYLDRVNLSLEYGYNYWYSRFQCQQKRVNGEYIFKIEYNFVKKELLVGFRHLNGKERFIVERCK